MQEVFGVKIETAVDDRLHDNVTEDDNESTLYIPSGIGNQH